MLVSEVALNKLKAAYRTNEKELYVTITRMKTIDIEHCRNEGEQLVLVFTDGTEEKINACDYNCGYETGQDLYGNLISEMVVSVDDVNGDYITAYGGKLTGYYAG